MIIEEFALFKQDVNLISQLPFDMLVKVLKNDKLQIEHEDELYNFVKVSRITYQYERGTKVNIHYSS